MDVYDGVCYSTLPENSFYSSDVCSYERSQFYQNYNNSEDKTVNSDAVELIVTNLDASIDIAELWSVLLNMFRQFCMVLNFIINLQQDGSLVANVKTVNAQQAHLAIAQLNHRWIGCKRISIRFETCSDSNKIRCIIITLLQDIPGNQTPLFKFFDLARSRYHTTISLLQLKESKDVCKIIETENGLMIKLTQEANVHQPLRFAFENPPLRYCVLHCPNGLESEECPNVNISLKLFQSRVKELLSLHMASMPLLSFHVCYALHFNQFLPKDDLGVPLEHLLTCVPNVYLIQSENIKFVKLSKDEVRVKKDLEDLLVKSISPSGADMSLLCREIEDLLKTVPNCRLLVTQFIPTYRQRYGCQCRLVDYGFKRLVDLFEAVSHVVQIIYCGTMKFMTLTHSAQMRRFTIDLKHILKDQILQQITIKNFSAAFAKIHHKPFNPVEYGLCSLEDLLTELSEGSVIVSKVKDVGIVAMPKSEQTAEEVERTKLFAVEIKELLRHYPHCYMPFHKFVPAYYHHFGHQCTVSDYGFTKLVELFNAIPETVEVEELSDIECYVKLKIGTALEVVGLQIYALIKDSKAPALHVEEVATIFKQNYGYTLKPQPYNCQNLMELAFKLNDFIQVTYTHEGPLLSIVSINTRLLEIRIWSLLRQPPHKSSLTKLKHCYRLRFLSNMPTYKLDELKAVVEISNDGIETIVSLNSFYTLAARLYQLLRVNRSGIEINKIPNIYFEKFGSTLALKEYGFKSLENLFQQMTFLISTKKKSNKIYLFLNKNVSGISLCIPNSIKEDQPSSELQCPPPAAHLLLNDRSYITPPKPDTPPALGCWNAAWNYSMENTENKNLQVNLSTFHIPKLTVDDLVELVSPSALNLFFPSMQVPKKISSEISSPHPSTLPIPDKFIYNDDSGYCGLYSFRQDGVDSSGEMGC